MSRVAFLLFLLFSSLEKNDFVSAEPCGSAGTTCSLVCVDDFQCDSKTIDDDVCTLEGFSGSFGSTDLDLSGLFMALNGMMANLFDHVKSLVLSLNLSGNIFCQDEHTSKRRIFASVSSNDQIYSSQNYASSSYNNQYYRSQTYQYTSYMGVTDVVEMFPNLKFLDVSNTLKWRLVFLLCKINILWRSRNSDAFLKEMTNLLKD